MQSAEHNQVKCCIWQSTIHCYQWKIIQICLKSPWLTQLNDQEICDWDGKELFTQKSLINNDFHYFLMMMMMMGIKPIMLLSCSSILPTKTVGSTNYSSTFQKMTLISKRLEIITVSEFLSSRGNLLQL